jgi:CubicO group peptidase (beta-lactamase class C family)
MSKFRFASGTCALALAIALFGGPPQAQAQDDSRWLTPTMIGARAHMFEPSLNYLTFQHMDQMFATRSVAAGGEVWQLPTETVSLEGDYTIGDKAMSLGDALEATSTNALVVVKGGKIVHETYRNGSDATTRLLTFSVAKSYVSTLIGLALSDGAIKSLDDKVTDYLPDLKGSGYERSTIRDLLRMRSGVDWLEMYQFGSDTQLTKVHDNSLVAYRYRWCDYAAKESKPGPNAPNAVFNYATLDTSVLGCILEKAVGKTGSEYMSE